MSGVEVENEKPFGKLIFISFFESIDAFTFEKGKAFLLIHFNYQMRYF